MVTGRRESQPRRRWRGKRERLRGQGPRASDLCDRVVDLVLIRRSAAPRRGVQSPPGQELLGAMTSLGPSRECYKPSRKSRGRPAQNGWRAGHGPGGVCSKDVSSAFGRDMRGSAIAASSAGRRRGPGRGGRPRRATGTTATGKQKRNGQSRRYRERVRSRKPPADEAVPDAARVITKKFFRRLL